MKNLFVIGNGFDIDHEIKTQYKEFRKFLVDKTQLDYNVKDCEEFIDKFSEPISWGDLSMSDEVEYAVFIFIITNLIVCNESISDFENWSEFETYLGKLSQTYFCIDDVIDDLGEIDELKTGAQLEDFFCNLKTAFTDWTNIIFSEWIASINTTVSPKNRTVENLSNESYFLSFNYTDVLESVYGISPERICHIHGFINDFGSEIVIGYGNDIEEYEDPNYLLSKPYIDEVIRTFRKDTTKHYNTHSDFFAKLQDVENIYFIGFNLLRIESVDSYYFKKLFVDLGEVNIYLNNFDKKNKERFIATLKSWGAKVKMSYLVDMDKDSYEKFVIKR